MPPRGVRPNRRQHRQLVDQLRGQRPADRGRSEPLGGAVTCTVPTSSAVFLFKIEHCDMRAQRGQHVEQRGACRVQPQAIEHQRRARENRGRAQKERSRRNIARHRRLNARAASAAQ